MGLWDIARGDLRAPFMNHRSQVVDAQFSPDGRLLLSCSEDGTARL
jgi:WD40 repeat protein